MSEITLPPRSEWVLKVWRDMSALEVAARLKWTAECAYRLYGELMGFCYASPPPEDPQYWLHRAEFLQRTEQLETLPCLQFSGVKWREATP